MPGIEGVNAIMIYADRPAELARWYRDNLGISSTLDPADSCFYGELGKWGDGRPVHFGIYPSPTPLGDHPRSVMINFRVSDLLCATDALRSNGVAIERTVEESYGSFAYLRDAEGNPIELWMENPALAGKQRFR